MENIDPSAQKARRGVPRWVYVVSFTLLIGFLILIGKQLMNTSAGPIMIGEKVPPITLTTYDGQTIQTKDLTGKVVVLNFWASWCKPCEQEAAELEMAYQYFKPGDQVVFLGLAYVDTEPNSLAYLQKFGITYPNGPDLRTSVSQMFKIRGVPETYIIDKEGKLAYAKIGPFTSLEEIIAVIEPLAQ